MKIRLITPLLIGLCSAFAVQQAGAATFTLNDCRGFGIDAIERLLLNDEGDIPLCPAPVIAHFGYFSPSAISPGLLWNKHEFKPDQPLRLAVNVTRLGAPGYRELKNDKNIPEEDVLYFGVEMHNGEQYPHPAIHIRTALNRLGLSIGDVTMPNNIGLPFGDHREWFTELENHDTQRDTDTILNQGDTDTILAVESPPIPIPEPASFFLFGTGIAGLAWRRARQKKTA